MDNEDFLRKIQEGLAETLRPYLHQLTQRQRMADFVKLCIRCAARDDFIQIGELLRSQAAGEVENEEDLSGCKEYFDRLRGYADEKVERYRIQFIEDLTARTEEAGLPLTVDFPRFSSLKGIEGTIDFSKRITVINKKTLKSIDPRRIVSGILKVKRKLYDRPFDPQAFIDNLYQIYSEILKKEKWSPGQTVPIQRFYFDFVISLQSKVFLQDMDKGKFRGYSLDQFAVDIWRTFQAGTGGTSEGYALQLRAGRNYSLWLIDSEGEKRQITGIAFQKVES